MPFSGGIFSFLVNSWNPAVSGQPIDPNAWNNTKDDLATGLSTALLKDGSQAATATIPFVAGISTDDIFEFTSGDGVTVDGVLLKDGRVDWSQAANVASATTPDIYGISGNVVVITGTTQIDGFATAPAGVTRWVKFSGILQLTYNATSLILPGAANITTAAGDTGQLVSLGSGNWQLWSFQRASGGVALTATAPLTATGTPATGYTIADATPLFQCRLTKVSTNLQLDRCNGLWLFINGVNYAVPQAGVTLAPSGLTLNTQYYIYAYMVSTTMTLEASATAPASDATYGHAIKTGDATRSLVGAVFVLTGPAFADSATQRYVVSYYNKRKVVGISTAVGPLTTSATSPTVIGSSPTVQYIYWTAFPVTVAITGNMSNGTGGNYADAFLRLGGVIQTLGQSRAYAGTNTEAGPISLYGIDGAGSAGLTVATGQLDMAGQVAVTGTASYFQISATAEFMG